MNTRRGTSSFHFATLIAVSLAAGFIATSRAEDPMTLPTDRVAPATTQSSAILPIRAASTRPAGIPPAIAELVETLDDVDPAARNEAADKLVAIGRDALPALGRAARSEVPQVRLRAIELLRRLPWDAADDPPGIARILSGYPSLVPERRRRIVRALVVIKGTDAPAAWRAVGRILLNDPDEEVLWEAVAQIRQHPVGMSLGLGPMDSATISLPMKVVAGRTMLQRQPQVGIDLLLNVLDEDKRSQHPAADRTEILVVATELERMARRDKHEAVAAQLLRDQFSRASAAQRVPLSRELYAIHATAGPLPGWNDDIAIRPPNLMDRPTLYAFARLEEHLGHVFSSHLLDRIAFFEPRWMNWMGFVTRKEPTERLEVADFLIQQGWIDAGERELNETRRAAPEEDVASHINALFHMVTIDAIRGNDFERGEHFRLALGIIERSKLPMIISGAEGTRLVEDEIQNLHALMHYSYFRAAKKARIASEMETHALSLVRLQPINDALLFEVYPALKQTGHTDEAQALFDVNYQSLKAKTTVGEHDPVSLNRLAWMCVSCDQHLDEARDLAQAAMAQDPNNPAIIDTLAEAEFHSGNATEAVRLESMAQKLSPKDVRIKATLERFRAGLRRSSHTSPTTQPDVGNEVP